MDRETLKRIVVDEVRRALAARQPASPSPVEASNPSPLRAAGLVILTDLTAPTAAAAAALRDAAASGFLFRAFASRTFAGAHLTGKPPSSSPIEFEAAPACEIAFGKTVESARWIAFPDISANSLAKSALGLRDSAPSNAIALALERGAPCLLLESRLRNSAPAQDDRQEHLRRLERRGARIVWPGTLVSTLDSLFPLPVPRVFQPPPPRKWERRAIVTADDVYEAARAGNKELTLPLGAIVTSQAEEEAARRGVILRREESR